MSVLNGVFEFRAYFLIKLVEFTLHFLYLLYVALENRIIHLDIPVNVLLVRFFLVGILLNLFA